MGVHCRIRACVRSYGIGFWLRDWAVSDHYDQPGRF